MRCRKTMMMMTPMSDDVLQENSMLVAAQDLEDNPDQVEDVQANNEYVDPKDPHSDEFENDDWVIQHMWRI